MKNKLYLIFTILMFLSWPFSGRNLAIAQVDVEDNYDKCDVNELPQIQLLNDIVSHSKCNSETGNSKCRCVQEIISQKNKDAKDPLTGKTEDPFSTNHVDEAYNQYQKNVDNLRKSYLAKYDTVYKLMTVQTSAQELALEMTSKDGDVVGCTPERMAEGIRKKETESIPLQLEALNKLRDDAIKDYNKCKNLRDINFRFRLQALGCDYFQNRSEILAKNIKKLEEKQAEVNTKNNDINKCGEAVKVFFNDNAKNDMKKIAEYHLNSKNQTDENKKVLINQIKEYSGNLLQPLDAIKLIKYATFWGSLAAGSSSFEELVNTNKISCDEMINSYNIIRSTYHNIIIRDNGEGRDYSPEGIDPKTQCKSHDVLCAAFAIKNEQISQEETSLLAKKSADECLSYAQYVTFMGMPSDDLLKEFAIGKPAKLLDDNSTWLNGHASKDKLKFLQSNPILAQIAKGGKDNDGLRAELGKSLQKMAKDILSNTDQSPAAKFDSYLKYMKDEKDGFKGIYIKSKAISKMNVCDSLQSSFTAITLANDLKGAATSSSESGDSDKTVLQCVAKLYDNTGTSDLDGTLKLDPVFGLGANDESSIPSEDDFKKFKAKYCSAINDLKNNDCANKSNKKCKEKVDIEAIKTVSKEHNIPESFDKKQLDAMTAGYDKTKEDKTAKAFWDKEIGSKINHNSLATKNDGGAYAATVAKNQAIMGSPDIQSRYEQYMNPAATANSSIAGSVAPISNNLANAEQGGFSRSSDDKNQVRPEFTANQSLAAPTSVPNYSSIPKETFEKSKEITDLDPVFDKRTDEQKLSTYKALEEFKEESGTAPDFSTTQAIKDLENKIATKTQEINEADKNKVEANKSAQGSGQVGNFRNIASVINPPISNAPMLSQFPRTSPVPSTEKNKAKAQASYEAALLNMGTGQIVIQGSNAEGPFVVAEIITADDSEGVYPFKNLKNPDVLSEFLALKVGDKIKTGESIKIKDPNSNDYFVIKATKKDGVTAYQLIPFVKKEVIRISTRAQLKHALNPKY